MAVLLFAFWAVFNLTAYHSYPFLRWEVLCSFLIVAASLSVPFILCRLFRQAWIFYVLLIILWLDCIGGVAYPNAWFIDQWGRGRWPWFVFFVSPFWSAVTAAFYLLWKETGHLIRYAYGLSAIGIFVIGYLERSRIRKGVSLALWAMIFAALLQFGFFREPAVRIDEAGRAHEISDEKKNILVLALDEHIGVEGIPPIHENAVRFKEQFIKKYIQRGFQIEGGAHSNYSTSNDSFPSIMNYAVFEKTYGRDKVRVEPNRLFEKWLEERYDLYLYQSDYLDFCTAFKNRYAECHEYKANSIGHMRNTNIPVSDKTWIMLSSYLEATHSYLMKRLFQSVMERQLGLPTTTLAPLGIDVILPYLMQDLEAHPSGSAFFVHLLLPHFPFVYDPECEVKELIDWEMGADHGDSDWNVKYDRYLEQTECLHKKLDTFFQWMQSEDLMDQTTVVLFGDHGSRIDGDDDERKLVDLYSTLFMIKPSGARSGSYHSTRESVSGLFHGHTGLSPDAGLSRESFRQIYVVTADMSKVKPGDEIYEKREMPAIKRNKSAIKTV